ALADTRYIARMRSASLVADRFEIESIAGEGGMGVVYRARDRRTDRFVALKLVGDVRHRERFEREARVLASLSHRAIVGHVDHGVTSDGRLYLAMEWVEGETLTERLVAGRLGVRATIALGLRVADALAHAHALGV